MLGKEIEATVTALLVRGDWACAYRDKLALRAACRCLAKLRPEVAISAREIAEAALTDIEAATRQWARLAGQLCLVRRPGF